MNGFWRRIVNLLVVLTLAFGAIAVVPGCREKGPAEEAGEAIDEAAENVGDAVEDAVD
jgi:hypothetical protein